MTGIQGDGTRLGGRDGGGGGAEGGKQGTAQSFSKHAKMNDYPLRVEQALE